MARSTGVGTPVPGAARIEADEPEISVPPVVRRRRAAQESTPPAADPSPSRRQAKQAAKAEKAAEKAADKAARTSARRGSTPQGAAATATAGGAPDAASEQGWFSRLLVPPDTTGPRVRLGVLWFLLALAAATSGRSWTAALWAVVAGLAGYQTVAAWQQAGVETEGEEQDADPLASGGLFRLLAATLAAIMPVAASYGTGTAGLVLILAPAIAVLAHVALGQRPGDAGPTVAAIVLPALASISVVLAVRVDLWAGLFLILAVSLYDAGAFLLGADAGGRWEGPVAGMIGALAVTFTMAMFQPPPFDRKEAWIAGVVVAVTCPIGQWLASAFLPSAESRAPALRRIDAYLVAGPAFVALAWLMS